jgi:hypothetical protein
MHFMDFFMDLIVLVGGLVVVVGYAAALILPFALIVAAIRFLWLRGDVNKLK